jgi:hypothetical protein
VKWIRDCWIVHLGASDELGVTGKAEMTPRPTKEQIVESLLAAARANKSKPKPLPEAEILIWPKLSEIELSRRQAIIDRAWEQHKAKEVEERELAKRTCHRGPGDPDWVV